MPQDSAQRNLIRRQHRANRKRSLRGLGVYSPLAVLAVALGAWIILSPSAFSQSQAPFANAAFQQKWERTDGPVASGAAKRPWIWGPVPGKILSEPFAGLPGNSRQVQYFDKGRMEINDPNGDPKDPFYVTNGLLAVELISGQMQTGSSQSEFRGPAQIDLASDADDPTAPTYQSFNGVSNIPGAPNERHKTSQVGQIVRTAIDRQGVTQPWPGNHPDYGVQITYFEPATGHNVASVFWDYLNSEGVISATGTVANGRLFEPWFAVTGYPISEPYWSYVKVDGSYTDVLIQAFERRVLTFVPHTATPFKVQMGNIGQHYYQWRYLTSPQPTPAPNRGAATPTSPVLPNKANVTVDSIQKRTSLVDLNSNFCVLTNRGQTPVLLNGWWIDSPKWSSVERFYFPPSITLRAGASITVHAGPGNNTDTDIYMYRTSLMWDGQPYDLAVLYDNYGREVSRLFPATGGGNVLPGGQPTADVNPTDTPGDQPTAEPEASATAEDGAPPPEPTEVPTSGTAATPTKVVPTPIKTGVATVGGTRTATPTRATTATTATVTATVTATPTRAP